MKGITAIVLAVCLMASVACSGDDGEERSSATSRSSTTTAVAEYEPVFSENPCPDGVPDDPRVECGTLTVPADRTAPDDGDVRLPVAIIRGAGDDPLPDPIVYFEGGPGFGALDRVGFFLDQDYGGRRDVILFDQRGTGRAEPNLDCTEIPEVVWTILGAARDSAVEVAAAQQAIADCRRRLEGHGVDFDDYDTPATADDAEDLRVALAIERWNLWGGSYGTTVALEVLRRHGDAVRSAVLDSVYPPDVPAAVDRSAGNARRAFDQLIGGCRADQACAARFGDLDEGFNALLREWDADPYEQDIVDQRTGKTRHLVLTGSDVVAGIWAAMYDTAVIPLLPSVIEALRARNDFAKVIVDELSGSGISQLIDSAEAMGFSVNCADRAALGGGAPVAEVIEDDPQLAGVIALGAPTQDCSAWEVEPVDAGFNEIADSDVPTLVLAGEYDPVTPPVDSERTAEALANATYVLFPGVGHGAVFAADCPEAIFRTFLEDPTADVDASCVDAMGPPAWSGV